MHQRFGITDSLRARFAEALSAFRDKLEVYLAVFGPLGVDLSLYVEERDRIVAFGQAPNEMMSMNRVNDVIDSILCGVDQMTLRMNAISLGPVMREVLFLRAKALDGQIHHTRIVSMMRAHFNEGFDGNPVERLQGIISCFENIEQEESRNRIRRTLSVSTAQRAGYGRDASKRLRDRNLRDEMKGERRNDDSKNSRRSKVG